MANPTEIGVDADQRVGREKSYKSTAVKQATWVAAKMTVELPRKLMDDLKHEANIRKLTHKGIIRDLALAWVMANKEGVVFEDYKRAIQEDVKKMELEEINARERQKAKLRPGDTKKKQQAKVKPKLIISERDKALHKENPFIVPDENEDGWKPY